jgi:drug/metabolite transporter (DMT)-like permease
LVIVTPEVGGAIAGLLAALFWAVNGLLIRAHGAGLQAVTINALRCSITGVVFLALWPFIATHQPVQPLTWVFLGTSLVAGLGVGDSLYFEAIKRIGVARAMPISMGYPVLAALGASVLLGESLSVVAVVGIALTLGGVYLVAQPSGFLDDPAPVGYWRGVLLAAIAAVSWSFSTIALRPVVLEMDVPTVSAVRMPLASALLWTVAWRSHRLPKAADLRGRHLLAIAATGLVTVLTTYLFLQSVQLAGAGRAAVLTATSPLFGVPFSILFLGERGSGRLGIGTVCSVIGVALLIQS